MSKRSFKEGKLAYTPGVNLMESMPYTIGTKEFNLHYADWVDGWHEAETECNNKQEGENNDL